ncbi:hypothetical protein E2542_SST09090 [Spatholobus suberectus]|nr:hypothetical protein E2542_SST09090 [Spatholobus suberectus]
MGQELKLRSDMETSSVFQVDRVTGGITIQQYGWIQLTSTFDQTKQAVAPVSNRRSLLPLFCVDYYPKPPPTNETLSAFPNQIPLCILAVGRPSPALSFCRESFYRRHELLPVGFELH